MGKIEQRLRELGITLPAPLTPPNIEAVTTLPIVIRGDRALLSGHVPQEPDGTVSDLSGSVGENITLSEAQECARLIGLSVLASLQDELGTLDNILGWTAVRAQVRTSDNFVDHPLVVDGFSDLIVEIFGREIGMHARSVSGVTSLPFGLPVAIETEVLVRT